MNQSAGLRRLSVTLAAFCVVVVVFATTASAQDQSNSHRRLELPQGGSSDFRMQMQMMSQLQKLLGQQQPDDSSSAPSVSPQQMNMLKKMMENFSGQVPEDLMKQVGNLPPEVISQIGQQIQNNPAAREQAMEMLKQFMQNRQLPQGNGSDGRPMLPPDPQNRSGPADENGNEESNSPRSSNNNRTPNGRNGEPESSGSEGDNGFSFKDFSFDKMMEKMREMERDAKSGNGNRSEAQSGSGNDSKIRIQSRNDRNQTGDEEWDPLSPDRQKNSPDNSSSSTQKSNQRLTPDEGASRIDEILRQRELRNGSEPNGRNPQSGGDARSSANAAEQSPDQDDGRIRSVSDFLKKFVPGNAKDLLGKSDGPATADGNALEAEKPTARSVEEIRKEQEEVKREVAQRGFAETLKRIGRDALRQAKSEGPGGAASARGSGSGGSGTGTSDQPLSDSMVEAITGIAKDVSEILKEEGVSFSKPSRQQRSTPGTSPRTANSNDSFLGGLQESAGEFMEDLSSTASVPEVMSAPDAEGISADALIPLFVFGLLAAFAFALAWRSGLIAIPGAEAASSGVVLTPGGIRTKADVVKAFHQMALNPERASDDWWTHQKVVDTLIQQEPDKSETAETLRRLYEVARYLPDDYEFTREQLEDARLAIAEYRS